MAMAGMFFLGVLTGWGLLCLIVWIDRKFNNRGTDRFYG